MRLQTRFIVPVLVFRSAGEGLDAARFVLYESTARHSSIVISRTTSVGLEDQSVYRRNDQELSNQSWHCWLEMVVSHIGSCATQVYMAVVFQNQLINMGEREDPPRRSTGS